jgi:hypothetical protein
MAVGLAVAAALDATIIRGILLPAAMKLLGDWNWWLPRKLDWLPQVELKARPPDPPDNPAPRAAPRRPSALKPAGPSTAERREANAQVAHGEPVQVPRATTRNSLGFYSEQPGELPLEAHAGELLDNALPDCVGNLVTA